MKHSVRIHTFETMDRAAEKEWRACKSKIRYGDRESAEHARLVMENRYSEKFDKYECGFCDGHHVAHALVRLREPEPVRS